MKRIAIAVLVLGMIFSMITPVYAVRSYWDLEAMPDFEDYLLIDYGYFASSEAILIGLDEAKLDKKELQQLTSEVVNIIESVDFVPEYDSSVHKNNEDLMLLHLAYEDWKVNTSTEIIHIYIKKNGIVFGVWDRKAGGEHYAFVSCNTDKILSEIYTVMKDTVDIVDNNRNRISQDADNEKAGKETELTSFKKLYCVKIKDAKYDNLGFNVNVDTEFGICSYKAADSATVKYAFYFGLGDNPESVYISDSISGTNEITFYDITIYRDSDTGNYRLYNKDAGFHRATARLDADETNGLTKLYLNVVNSNFEGEFEKSRFTSETGTLKNYGNIAITYQRQPDNDDISLESSEDKETVIDVQENEAKTDSAEIHPDADKLTEKATDDNKEEKQNVTEYLKPENDSEEKNQDLTEKSDAKEEADTDANLSEDKKDDDSVMNKDAKESKEKVLESDTSEYKTNADKLYELGLFKGTENGYELESGFTRAQGATMLVRLLGKEKEALDIRTEGIMADVPGDNWAAPYVEYCYINKITKGTGNNCYSPDELMSGSQYVTLVLRALGYADAEPETAGLMSVECGLLTNVEALNVFSTDVLDRGTMVNISYCALTAEMRDGDKLINKLIDCNTVDKSKATDLGILEQID